MTTEVAEEFDHTLAAQAEDHDQKRQPLVKAKFSHCRFPCRQATTAKFIAMVAGIACNCASSSF